MLVYLSLFMYLSKQREAIQIPPHGCSRTSSSWCGGVQPLVLKGRIGRHSETVLLSHLPTLSLL